MVKRHDDQLSQNAREVEAILDQDNVFAVLPIATIASFSGAKKLEAAKIPTFGWGINDEWGGPPNFFGHLGALCNGSACPGITVPWVMHKLGKHKVGILGYNVPSSADCVDGLKSSFDKYGKSAKAKIVYTDKALSFGVTDLSTDVKNMVDNGVDFVTTCMDTNGVLTLAKEMRQQGLQATQYLPNGYDQAFMKKNGGFFENSVVITQIAPIETKPPFPALKNYVKFMKKQGKPLTENAEIGWVNADNFVTGLKLAGPNFTQQKLIDGLNTETAFTDNGMIVPINWTYQHNDPRAPDGTVNPKYANPYSCGSTLRVRNGEFVPLKTPPGLPWICTTGVNPPTLTKTPVYRTFKPGTEIDTTPAAG